MHTSIKIQYLKNDILFANPCVYITVQVCLSTCIGVQPHQRPTWDQMETPL